MAKDYQYVVFGATGFTGKYVCKELLKCSASHDVKIAFAGRNRKKLEEVTNWAQADSSIRFDVGNIGFIIADVDDDQSLLNMCKQCKIVLDCVGPYKFLGEAVVKACIDGGSDYVDITGEPEFMERMKKKYDDAAASKGVYIVHACGFDCVPSEAGMIFAKKQFKGTLASVENYFSIKHGKHGMTGNFGTYASIVHGVSDVASLQKLRKSMAQKPIPFCGPKLKVKGIHFDKNLGKYALPFLGADVSVVKRSQRYYFEQFQEIPTQFAMYFTTSFIQMVSILFFLVVLKIMTTFSWGSKLLLRYPGFFTAGGFSKHGPTEQQMAESGSRFIMRCKGYKNVVGIDEFTKGDIKGPPDTEMVVKIIGPEIGYVLTPIVMIQSAICLKDQRDSLPPKGGVYTPGPAFKDTTFIEQLQENGIHFEVVS